MQRRADQTHALRPMTEEIAQHSHGSGAMRQIARERDRATLYAVNFFMADMSAGMGPFLGVLLASRGWSSGAIGTVITLGAIVGMVAVPLAGAVVDATTRKRSCVIAVGLCTVAASALILSSRQFGSSPPHRPPCALPGRRLPRP